VDGLGIDVKDELRLEMLLAEADVLARAGLPAEARHLLAAARDLAEQTGAWSQLGQVALAVAELGAVFSARRDEVVRELERARAAASGLDNALEARLAASLARALQHSVPADRAGARPLSERALELGREAGDPETLIACLLAKHDVLWAPGSAATRAELAQEIVTISERARKSEHRAQGLLLLANARLELGSPSFMAPLEECLAQLQQLGEGRHRYTVETRRAAVALLLGDLDDASIRIERAAELGERIREPEAAMVRMAQRLELVRARGEPEELVAFARGDVGHWRSAPILANALAAGFLARAGEIGEASRHVRAVTDLGTWRTENSYAWSVLVRELAVAAIAIADRELCAELLSDLLPLAGTCGVNGAVVSFAGSHAHAAALLAGALGEDTELLMAQADEAYTRLGAAGWLSEVRRN
jgi:hypothetical protein